MKKYIYSLYILFSVVFISSCTNLDEEIYSSISTDEFFKNEQEMIMDVGRIYYELLSSVGHGGLWGTDVITSDEGVCPVREGNLWWDNGGWLDLHRHDFYDNSGNISNCWGYVFNGVTVCNQVLYRFKITNVDFPTKKNLEAEVKIIRAWLYLIGIDLFGDIPLVTDFTDTSLPEQSSRETVFRFIESEINDNINLLDEVPTKDNYGRVSQAFANTVLAKLYLNAEEWIGKEMWKEASAVCDKIIGKLSLEPNYFDNFLAKNENSKENIFVLIQDNVYSVSWMRFHQVCLHALSQQTFGILDGCWDGFCAIEEHYNLYEDNDIRKKGWLVGPQFDTSGNPLYISEGRQLTYRPTITSIHDPQNPALLDDGVRFCKYEYAAGTQNAMTNDFAVYRYADVLLMKTEALFRLGKVDEALPYINEVRRRAGVSEYKREELTLDEILNERSRELAWEGHRRQDLIRFGKWTDAWYEKEQKDDHVKLFPIPYTVLNSNPNLKQNPGY